MYKSKMAVAIKTNGKVLREFGDAVMLPFESEYSIYLKNMNSVRAIAHITIDGQDVCPDGLVVNANNSIDIERFIKDLNQGNRFKFIARTAKIEDGPRGIKVEDGLIRVAFKFEKRPPKVEYETAIIKKYIYEDHYKPYYTHSPFVQCSTAAPTSRSYSSSSSAMIGSGTGATIGDPRVIGATIGGTDDSRVTKTSAFRNLSGDVMTGNPQTTVVPVSDVGITVPGSISSQQFVKVEDFPLETEEHVIVLRLVGHSGETPITTPVTVKTTQKCVTCGHINKATSKFCTECGTSLILV